MGYLEWKGLVRGRHPVSHFVGMVVRCKRESTVGWAVARITAIHKPTGSCVSWFASLETLDGWSLNREPLRDLQEVEWTLEETRTHLHRAWAEIKRLKSELYKQR